MSNVTITEREYRHLLARDSELCILEDAGVDNWDGYDGRSDTYVDDPIKYIDQKVEQAKIVATGGLPDE